MRGVIDAAGDVKEIWPDRGLIIRYYTGTFFFSSLHFFPLSLRPSRRIKPTLNLSVHLGTEVL